MQMILNLQNKNWKYSSKQAFNQPPCLTVEGTMTAKQAFASMAKSILSMIAKIIIELLVAKALTAALEEQVLETSLGGLSWKTWRSF